MSLLVITLFVCSAIGLGLSLLYRTARADGNAITVCPDGCDHTSISDAVGAAGNGDLILVAAGTYSGQVTISNTLTIQGAGIPSTTVDGKGTGWLFDIRSGAAVTLAGMTLTGGVAPTVNGEGAGGAIYNLGILHLISATVTGNRAQGVNGNPVSGNGGKAYGGGVYNGCSAGVCGSVSLSNTQITGNSVAGGNGNFFWGGRGGDAHGGGLYNACSAGRCGQLFIENSTISGNHASGGDGGSCDIPGVGSGGGIYNSGMLSLITALVDGNQVSTGHDPCFPHYAGVSQGGGIFNSGFLTLSAGAVVGNYSDYGGGLYIFPESSAQLNNTTISGNEVYYYGGGIYNAGYLSLVNTTIVGNIAGNEDSREGGAGGGLYNVGIPELANSLLSGNDAGFSDDGGGPDCIGVLVSKGHNLIENLADCHIQVVAGDILGQPAHIFPLGDNGGPTPTHALKFLSPALDAGDPLLCPEADQRGIPRPADGDGDGIPVCDIGAYEGFIPPAGVMFMPAVFHQGAAR